MENEADKKADRTEEMSAKQTAWQAVKFTLFSTSAGAIEFLSFTLLNELTGFPYWPSYLIALTLSVLYNFTVNRRFTFKSAANVPIAMLKVLGFYLVFTPLSTWAGHTAEGNGANEYIVLGITMICNLLLEYLFCRFVVYRGTINTNDLAKKDKESGSPT
ncbi:MAG: GtrA family protein [Treponema sp.]|jgi:putative flippase GtrA|nr:GtrA family protein [Treponema sp.]